ncbi:MAG: thioredoxin family protein [Chloroflexi bacterium]|nr:thioredoxin family protein [Chloroflexota bacterium]
MTANAANGSGEQPREGVAGPSSGGPAPAIRAYVESGCRSCGYALELMERVRHEYPTVRVEVVDVGVSSERLPDGVFAVPTVVLDGNVISLGTPSWERLAEQIEATIAAAERAPSHESRTP